MNQTKALWLGALLLTSAGLFALHRPTTTASPNAAEVMADAWRLGNEQGLWRQGMLRIQQAIEAQSSEADRLPLNIGLARMAARVGDLSQAADLYRRFTPPRGDPGLAAEAARVLLVVGQPGEAAALLEQARQGRAGHDFLDVPLAEAYAMQSQMERSMQVLPRTYQSRGGQLYGSTLRAAIMLSQGDAAGAHALIARVEAPLPRDGESLLEFGDAVQFYIVRGVINARAGHTEAARADMRQSWQLSRQAARWYEKRLSVASDPFFTAVGEQRLQHMFVDTDCAVLLGHTWAAQDLTPGLLSWKHRALQRLSPDLRLPLWEREQYEKLDALATHLDQGDLSAARQDVATLADIMQQRSTDCVLWSLAARGPSVASLHLLAGDLARRAGDAAAARVAYQKAAAEPATAFMAQARLSLL